VIRFAVCWLGLRFPFYWLPGNSLPATANFRQLIKSMDPSTQSILHPLALGQAASTISDKSI